jgi:phosphatidate cytidylyltransferase
MTLFSNPMSNPLLVPVVLRLLAVLGGGLVLVVLLNLRRLKGLFQSETWKRYVAWVVMAPSFVISVFVGGGAALLFVGVMMFTALREYWRLLGLPVFFRKVLVVNAVLSLAVGILLPRYVHLLPFAYLMVTAVPAILRNRVETAFDDVCKTVFGSVWISFSLTHVVLYRTLENGMVVLLMVGFGVALADVLAFCTGKLFNRLDLGTGKKIAQNISPNKTWLGAIGNLVGALTGALVVASSTEALGGLTVVGLGLVIGGVSVAGDLLESMLKRNTGVKDSGAAIPGHGGVLDRLDSLLVSVVACFYWVTIAG